MGKASDRRAERVKSLLLSTLSEIIRDELSDPRLGIFSMTDLHLARDLSTAEVLVATVGGKEATAATVAALNGAVPLLWNRLRHETDLRHVPKLRFSADNTGEYSDQVFRTLEQLHESGEFELGNEDVELEGAGPSARPVANDKDGRAQGPAPSGEPEEETSKG